jgi:hypothetical protein
MIWGALPPVSSGHGRPSGRPARKSQKPAEKQRPVDERRAIARAEPRLAARHCMARATRDRAVALLDRPSFGPCAESTDVEPYLWPAQRRTYASHRTVLRIQEVGAH